MEWYTVVAVVVIVIGLFLYRHDELSGAWSRWRAPHATVESLKLLVDGVSVASNVIDVDECVNGRGGDDSEAGGAGGNAGAASGFAASAAPSAAGVGTRRIAVMQRGPTQSPRHGAPSAWRSDTESASDVAARSPSPARSVESLPPMSL
jgi:hypothetical protein